MIAAAAFFESDYRSSPKTARSSDKQKTGILAKPPLADPGLRMYDVAEESSDPHRPFKKK
jgi:hypothetical protein